MPQGLLLQPFQRGQRGGLFRLLLRAAASLSQPHPVAEYRSAEHPVMGRAGLGNDLIGRRAPAVLLEEFLQRL